MALYLGEDKVKLNLDGIVYFLNLCSEMPVFDGGILLSSDGYILHDSNGLYLTANGTRLLSSDGYILKDLNDYYLTIEEVG